MKLLIVDCCISQRGEASRTRRLLRAYVESFCRSHPDVETETVTPETLLSLQPFDPAMLDERDALASVQAWDAPVYDLARQFRAADAVVVAAPFWDLSFPAALRTYIEYISANGLTYHYEPNGCPRGLPGAAAGVPHHRRRRGAGGLPGGAVLAAALRHVRHRPVRRCIRRRTGPGSRRDGGAGRLCL